MAHARRDRNLFILDLATPAQVMQAIKLRQSTCPVTRQVNKQAMQAVGPGRPTHLVSKHKKVRVWHRRFGHASNARIIRASKLLTDMGDFDNAYDPTEVYSDSEQSNSDDDEAAKMPENLEEPAQAGGTLGNSEGKKTRLENPEEPAHAGGTLSRSERNVESTALPASKASALVTPVEDSDFDSLCTPCIASKQTRTIIRKPMT